MEARQQAEGAVILLQQMSEYPDVVLDALDSAEQAALTKELDVLADRATAIRTSTDLLGVVDAIYHLVQTRAALRTLLLPDEAEVTQEQSQRRVTLADQQFTDDLSDYAQQLAPQIRNSVVECRGKLQALLQNDASLGDGASQGVNP